MKDPRKHWKTTGIAVGAAAFMSAVPVGSAEALPATHFAHEPAGLSALQETGMARTAEQQLQLQLIEERFLARLGGAVSALEARAAALGAPSTLTSQEAGRFQAALGAASFVRHRLAALAAHGDALTPADAAALASLRSRAATVTSELRAALSGATIVRPASTDPVKTTAFAKAAQVKAADVADPDGDGHFCDGDHHGADFANRDGDHQFGDHHRFGGFRR